MIALMAITLYTSRVLLATLGITDFGIYSVVGSVTATFYSLRSVFAEAIQRFLNFEEKTINILYKLILLTYLPLLPLVKMQIFLISNLEINKQDGKAIV